jgi:hypothetical protein
MADSSISVSGLIAIGGVGQVTLRWNLGGGSCLSYLAGDVVEVWSATINNRASATKIGEVSANQFVHAGLILRSNRWYWVRARDVSGNLGDWFPSSATAGVLGTPSNAAIDEDLDEVRTDLTTQITQEKTERITDDAALAALLSEVEATANGGTASGRLLFNVKAGPAGFTSSIELTARAQAASGARRLAGLLIDVGTTARVRIVGSQFVVENDDGTILALFTSNGRVAKAFIPQITADLIQVSSLEAISSVLGNVVVNGNLLLNGSITVGKAANYAFSRQEVFRATGPIDVSRGRGNVLVASRSISGGSNAGARVKVICAISIRSRSFADTNAWGTFRAQLYRDGVLRASNVQRPDDEGQEGNFVLNDLDENCAGTHAWTVRVEWQSGPGPGDRIDCYNRFLTCERADK